MMFLIGVGSVTVVLLAYSYYIVRADKKGQKHAHEQR